MRAVDFDKYFDNMGEAPASYRSTRIYLIARQRIERLRTSYKLPTIREITTIISESRTSISCHIKSLIEYNKPTISSHSKGHPRILTAAKEDTIILYVIFYF